MTNKYLNLWAKKLNVPKPEFYENDARKIGEHRGVGVFKLFDRGFDFVLAGACITQRAGASDYDKVIDEIMDGQSPVCDEVKAHINSHGGRALSYDEYCRAEAELAP